MPYTQSYSSIYDLFSRFDELSTAIDPDFDAGYEELDREFAERRLQFGNE